MAVLNREQIKALGLVTREDGMEEEQYQPHGVDLTVKSVDQFDHAGAVFQHSKDLAPVSPYPHWVYDSYIYSGAYLISFNETVNLPPDIMAYLKPRSTLLRCGVTLETAVWDAGYHGSGQSLLVVHNPAGFYLAEGSRVAQLVFHRLEQETEGYSGSYQGEGLPTNRWANTMIGRDLQDDINWIRSLRGKEDCIPGREPGDGCSHRDFERETE